MSVKILIGDVREQLKTLADESVHCVVTSPPYWGLRDYGTGAWFGGLEDCDHLAPPRGGRNPETAGKQLTNGGTLNYQFTGACGKCGAQRVDTQIGQEPTYQQHVETIADVFDEVKRVLRKDGTLWLNYGDSYAASVNGRSAADVKALGNDDRTFRDKPFSTIQGVLKPKDLCGIPWRVAFALQERGWYLRQDIIWAKPNPMPESVKDRCTKAHEYIFLLTKSPRYYFDAEAIAEESLRSGDTNSGDRAINDGYVAGGFLRGGIVPSTRNKRSVWEIATSPFPDAHFATFPPELPEICIKAGTSEKGCCGKCGKPWVRETERPKEPDGLRNRGTGSKMDFHTRQTGSGQKLQDWLNANPKQTIGWSPSCKCEPLTKDCCTVLDPFGGAGTTGLVADRLQRNAILIELNPAYAALARKRIDGDAPLFSPMEAAE